VHSFEHSSVRKLLYLFCFTEPEDSWFAYWWTLLTLQDKKCVSGPTVTGTFSCAWSLALFTLEAIVYISRLSQTGGSYRSLCWIFCSLHTNTCVSLLTQMGVSSCAQRLSVSPICKAKYVFHGLLPRESLVRDVFNTCNLQGKLTHVLVTEEVFPVHTAGQWSLCKPNTRFTCAQRTPSTAVCTKQNYPLSHISALYSGWLSSSSLSVPVVQDSSLPESPHDLKEDGEDSLMSGRPWLAV
jgi:hypothetical protein